MFWKQKDFIVAISSIVWWRTALLSPRKIVKGPNINPCGTAPKRECHTDMQGTFSHLTSHSGSRTLYMRTVFGVNQLSSIPACHFIRICIFPVINMSIVMERDALYWLNWADFVYGMHFFWAGVYFFIYVS